RAQPLALTRRHLVDTPELALVALEQLDRALLELASHLALPFGAFLAQREHAQHGVEQQWLQDQEQRGEEQRLQNDRVVEIEGHAANGDESGVDRDRHDSSAGSGRPRELPGALPPT